MSSDLAKLLKELRQKNALSLYALEEGSGVDRKNLQRYESGQYLPTRINMDRLARFYKEEAERLWFVYFEAAFTEEELPNLEEWANLLLKWVMSKSF